MSRAKRSDELSRFCMWCKRGGEIYGDVFCTESGKPVKLGGLWMDQARCECGKFEWAFDRAGAEWAKALLDCEREQEETE